MADIQTQELVRIPAEGVTLEGILAVGPKPRGTVIFAHGSGSSRHSRRNNAVAQVLRDSGVGTLLFDLLTTEEDAVYENRFDIALLTRRLIAASRWVERQPETEGLQTGYFGASTGAAAALEAAADLGPDVIRAVVSRGGRPDMVGGRLRDVLTPTLLIVGGDDDVVLRLNRQALQLLGGPKELRTIPGATHLFEEPGALEEVARLAIEWFGRYLGVGAA